MTYTNLTKEKALFEYLLRLGDDRLILSQRLADWCGHGPILEEDIAMTNFALDHLGQAQLYLRYAGEIEGKNRTEDELAFFRNEREFRNIMLVEQENTDFAFTMLRQFFFDVFELLFYDKLIESSDEKLKSLAEKSIKETKYHLRHSTNWINKLGGGTEESNKRLSDALDFLWMFTGELFYMDEVDNLLISESIVPNLGDIKDAFYKQVNKVLVESNIEAKNPEDWMQTGGRLGKHTENLGHILAEMQYLPRSMPNAKW